MKTLLRWLVGGLLIGMAPKPGYACSCIDGGPFVNIVQRVAWQPNTLIARVQVIRPREHGIEVGVLDVLHGSEDQKTITVWGDPGHLCRTYTSGFKPGERLIFILHRLPPSPYPPYQNEQPGDYELSGCGTFILRENQTVTGRITDTRQSQSYSSFLAMLRELLDASAPDKPNLYPVPVTTDLTVAIPPQNEPLLSVQVINAVGRVVQTYQLATGETHRLPLTTLPGGVYVIRFTSEHSRLSRRVVKQ